MTPAKPEYVTVYVQFKDSITVNGKYVTNWDAKAPNGWECAVVGEMIHLTHGESRIRVPVTQASYIYEKLKPGKAKGDE